LGGQEDWKLEKDLNRLEKRADTEGNKVTPDAGLLRRWREEIREIKGEIRRRAAPIIAPIQAPAAANTKPDALKRIEYGPEAVAKLRAGINAAKATKP